MAATCPPLDPNETRQVSGPRDSPCTRLFLDFAKKALLARSLFG